MRISDWSSDVCSSDLGDHDEGAVGPGPGGLDRRPQDRLEEADVADRELGGVDPDGEPAGAGIEIIAGQRALSPFVQPPGAVEGQKIGRASCRGRVCRYV